MSGTDARVKLPLGPVDVLHEERREEEQTRRIEAPTPKIRMRVGCPWRGLPRAFGIWNSIFKRFNAWSAAGKWSRILKALSEEPDFEWVFIDGTYAKAHQHSAGARGGGAEAIGASRAGRASKIHLAVDTQGLPVEFEITGGQINDCTAAPGLIE